MTSDGSVDTLPKWALPFLPARRYKVAYGGRGSGKSWAFARMALLRATSRPINVLCARELQGTIRDSVHRLIVDQIPLMGLKDQFQWGRNFIRCKNGSEFVFKGLRHNANEIKSTERVAICWVEEAQGVSDDSWELLIPTIRSKRSEIWITFNPDQDTDPTYKRFVENPPPGALVRKISWKDNPYFTKEMDDERLWKAKTDPDGYSWVWEGNCRQLSDAQVLKGKISIDIFDPGQDWDGPYFGADWGFSVDPTAVVKLWVHQRRLYVEYEAWGVGVEIDRLTAFFDRIPDVRQHTIRADSARPETISYMRRNGFHIVGAEKGKGSVEDGVTHLRGYEQIIIHQRCEHAIEEARLWQYKTDRLSGDVKPELKPGNDHVWDAVRYALEPLMSARTGAYAGSIRRAY